MGGGLVADVPRKPMQRSTAGERTAALPVAPRQEGPPPSPHRAVLDAGTRSRPAGRVVNVPRPDVRLRSRVA
jgi:hypothetical protein